MTEASLEVAFQKGSPLSVGLTTVFADIIRFKNQYTGDPANRDRDVLERVAKVMVPAMTKVITGATGIQVHSVELSQSFSCNFGIQMYLGDNPANAIAVLSRAVGDYRTAVKMNQIIASNNFNPVTLDQLHSISEAFDKKVGYLRNDLIPDRVPIAIDIFFDPYSAFLMDTVHPNAKTLEPQEITAVMLHELGHIFSLLEICAETTYRHDIMQRSVEYFGQHAPVQEVAKYVNEAISSNGGELPDGFMSKLTEGLRSRSTIFGRIIVSIFNLLSTLGIFLIPVIFLTRCFGSVRDSLNLSKIDPKLIKTSETKPHLSQIKQIENYADAYVTRHGYGSYLLSALSKMESWFDSTLALGRAGKHYNLSWTLAKIPTYVSAILFGNSKFRYDEHDTWTNRADSIMQETLKIFKNDNLPPDVLAYYLNDYKTCSIMMYNRSGTIKLRDAMEKFWKFVEYVMATPLALFTSARFDQEYEKLIQYVESLKNNRLYYYKAYFQNKLNNM